MGVKNESITYLSDQQSHEESFLFGPRGKSYKSGFTGSVDSIWPKGGLKCRQYLNQLPYCTRWERNILAFNAGVLVDVGVSNRFSLQPQLLYKVKGIKFTVADHSHTIRLQSVDLPIFAVYKPLPGLFIGAGPNFGYNLSGKNVAAFATGDEVHAYAFSNADYDFKRFDFGVGGLIGYEHASGLFVSVTYLKGLRKVCNVTDYVWSNNVLSISVGYLLGKRK